MHYKNNHGVKSAEKDRNEYMSAFAKSNHRLWRNYSSYWPAKKGFQLQQLDVVQKVINNRLCVLPSSLSTAKTINQLLS